MAEVFNSNLYDARALFAAKRELAENLNGPDMALPEVAILSEALAGQRNAFLENMRNHSLPLTSQLRESMPLGTQYALILESPPRPLPVELLEEEESSIAAEEFEVGQRDTDNLCLFITPRAIEHTAKMAERIILRDDMTEATARRCRLEAAGVILAWMAFGKLAFESIGSHEKTAVQVNPHSLAVMSKLSDIKLPQPVGAVTEQEAERDDHEFSEAVSLMFIALKYKSAGCLAYEGLMEYSKQWKGPVIDRVTAGLFQSFYRGMVEERLRQSSGSVSMLDYALSDALPVRQLPVLYEAMRGL